MDLYLFIYKYELNSNTRKALPAEATSGLKFKPRKNLTTKWTIRIPSSGRGRDFIVTISIHTSPRDHPASH